MTNTVIPVKGTGYPKLTAKTVVYTNRNSDTDSPEQVKQNYIDRVRAYIPVEVVAFFIFVNSLVSENVGSVRDLSTLTADGYVAVLAAIVGIIGTIIYSRLSANSLNIQTWKLSTAVAVAGFCIWIYAMDAKLFDVLELGVVPSVSGLLLATFTLFVGLVVPTTDSDIHSGQFSK